ncbi:RagB/SusD family nutrient uptake outer membrane protein [Pedobacter gandavensis]|uniref:RagB/SusD family nutrient uptake outer membrane protein n=1 Tax=Pedobacter gandavensis TaxID=2679963 RepID=UPI002931C43A|nr:RagB/SusD family nutrient uptake outer membrane protein [Pedobacter gandavensis]
MRTTFNIYRNNGLKLLIVIALLANFTACKKALTEEPKSVFNAEKFFNSVDEADLATLGVYQSMCNQNTLAFYASILYENDNDIAQVRDVVTSDFRGVAHYAITSESIYTQGTWQTYYEGINRANLVIEKIPQMASFNQEGQGKTLNRYLGEAKFLRGYYYAELVRLFGGVPIKLTPTRSGDDLRLAKATTDEVYQQVIKDMTEAIALLPEGKTSDERISKVAVKGMLARIALFAGGFSLRQNGKMEQPSNYKELYQIAQKQSKEVMESGVYTLNPSFEQFFRNQCQLKIDPNESMFEVAFYNLAGATPGSSVIGQWNAPAVAASTTLGRTNSYVKTTPLFRNSFLAGDLRRDIAVSTYQINAAGQAVEYTAAQDQNYAPGKWRREYQLQPIKDLNNTDINYVVLRYADVLLMRAEAENELNEGPNAAAYEAINMVRRRAFGKPVNTVDPTVDLPAGLSKAEFFERLKNERAWELCFEGLRKYDLLRWNILGSSLRATETALKTYRSTYPYIAGTMFKEGKHELYPIPLREIDLNKKLFQNPNY